MDLMTIAYLSLASVGGLVLLIAIGVLLYCLIKRETRQRILRRLCPRRIDGDRGESERIITSTDDYGSSQPTETPNPTPATGSSDQRTTRSQTASISKSGPAGIVTVAGEVGNSGSDQTTKPPFTTTAPTTLPSSPPSTSTVPTTAPARTGTIVSVAIPGCIGVPDRNVTTISSYPPTRTRLYWTKSPGRENAPCVIVSKSRPRSTTPPTNRARVFPLKPVQAVSSSDSAAVSGHRPHSDDAVKTMESSGGTSSIGHVSQTVKAAGDAVGNAGDDPSTAGMAAKVVLSDAEDGATRTHSIQETKEQELSMTVASEKEKNTPAIQEASEELNESVTEEPKGSVTEEPKGSVTEEPKGSVTEEPKGSVTEEPKGSAAEEPKGSAAEEPKGSAAEEPKGSAAEEPRGSAVEEPTGSEVAEPTGSEAAQPTGSEAAESMGSEAVEPMGSVTELLKGPAAEEPTGSVTGISSEEEPPILQSGSNSGSPQDGNSFATAASHTSSQSVGSQTYGNNESSNNAGDTNNGDNSEVD